MMKIRPLIDEYGAYLGIKGHKWIQGMLRGPRQLDANSSTYGRIRGMHGARGSCGRMRGTLRAKKFSGWRPVILCFCHPRRVSRNSALQALQTGDVRSWPEQHHNVIIRTPRGRRSPPPHNDGSVSTITNYHATETRDGD
jgi:hypothetical protein